MEFVTKRVNGKDFLELTEANANELKYLQLYFKRRVDNWQFKRGANSSWDGYINYFIGNRWLPEGLWKELVDYSQEAKLELEIKGLTAKFDVTVERDAFYKFCLDLFADHEITPRNYQIETAYKIIKWKKTCAELATSAGKSLIMFLVCAYIKLKINSETNKRKVIVIVPNINLVEQMVEDFQEYDPNNKLDFTYQTLFSGSKKRDKDSFITISTFQTAVKKEEELKAYTDVFLDEAHRIVAKSVRQVLDMCINKDLVVGLSGTLPKPDDAGYFTIQQYTGPIIKKVSAKELMDAGYITPCKIKIVKLNWLQEEYKEKLHKEFLKGPEERKGLFRIEKLLITSSEKRLEKITDIITDLKTNRLVLFQDVKNSYGKRVAEILREKNKSEVHYIDGSVSKNQRQEIINKMKDGGDDILVATYKTLGEGLSIKPIRHIFFIESYKSEEIIRQAIGRGLRQYKGKEVVDIIDFVDDFTFEDWGNYHIKHHHRRMEIYDEQEFPYKIFELTF